MAISTPVALDQDLQKLIDARLDTIDRMLMGRVPRADRQSILREVESQIDELVSQKEPETLSSEEVLEILAQLDPPEAYLVAGTQEEFAAARAPRFARNSPFRLPREKPRTDDRLPAAAGMIGILSLALTAVLTPAVTFIALGLDSDVVLYWGLGLGALIGIIMGMVGLLAGLMSLGKGPWPLAAIATGALAVILSLILPVAMHTMAYQTIETKRIRATAVCCLTNTQAQETTNSVWELSTTKQGVTR